MKIRFAVGPHAGSLAGAEMAAFCEALEIARFDGLWLSDLSVATVLDPIHARRAGRTDGSAIESAYPPGICASC